MFSLSAVALTRWCRWKGNKKKEMLAIGLSWALFSPFFSVQRIERATGPAMALKYVKKKRGDRFYQQEGEQHARQPDRTSPEDNSVSRARRKKRIHPKPNQAKACWTNHIQLLIPLRHGVRAFIHAHKHTHTCIQCHTLLCCSGTDSSLFLSLSLPFFVSPSCTSCVLRPAS